MQTCQRKCRQMLWTAPLRCHGSRHRQWSCMPGACLPVAEPVDVALQALEKYNIEKDIAAYIKKEFDKKYNPTWHCIVGRNFGVCWVHLLSQADCA